MFVLTRSNLFRQLPDINEIIRRLIELSDIPVSLLLL